MAKIIVTRFAPSPTGYLHIGGARTALFNYLYAKRNSGKFLLRIEDTDVNRSTKEAVDAILNGLDWLGLKPDEPPVFQMQNQKKHIDYAIKLLDAKKAYKCFCTKEELEQKRKIAEKEGKSYVYDRTCRNLTTEEHPKDKEFTVRIKSETTGITTIVDSVMGKIEVKNETLDDFIILRANQTPTYMFAVVVDDYEMNITHVIRGDDHLTNTFRQYQIYKAFGWDIPNFSHLPLIYSSDGKKMSKRHGAVSVEEYKNLGFLPEAILNYLLLLGWSYGKEEIISLEQATSIFDISDVNKSPSRFDFDKLRSINFHYLREKSNEDLLPILQEIVDTNYPSNILNPNYKNYLIKGLTPIKDRAKTTIELVEKAEMYLLKFPLPKLDEKAYEVLKENSLIITQQVDLLFSCKDYSRDTLHNIIKDFAENNNLKLGKAIEGLRILLCGSTISAASVFDIMETLGKEETLKRIQHNYLN